MPFDSQGIPLLGLGSILLGVLGIALLNVYHYRRWKILQSSRCLELLEASREALLRELAQLDRQYAGGSLQDQDYALERARRTQQLVEMTMLCKSLSSK